MNRIIEIFKEISEIPRESGNEKEVCDYLIEFAKKNNYKYYSDELYNVLIEKDGDRVGIDPIILQCHTDMVCVKKDDSDHDFKTDSIDIVIDDDKIYAKDTTLGADNGIGIAICLYILEKNDISHPPLEVLFTTNEETGLDGASNFDVSKLSGRTLINVDGEEEGHILLSCAGGTNAYLRKKLIFEELDKNGYRISIRNLLGGHSGLDIDKNHLSAIFAISRLLMTLNELDGFRLSNITGGEANNVIPSRAEVSFVVDDISEVYNIIENVEFDLKNEFEIESENIKFNLQEVKLEKVYDSETHDSIINLLSILPYGKQKMSQSIEGMVQISLTNAVLKTDDEEFELEILFRSSLASEMEYYLSKVRTISKITGFDFEVKSSYPAWELNMNSSLKDVAVQCYKNLFNENPVLESIHAGLECAVFKDKIPEIDMISIGAEIKGAHTIKEEVSIDSIDNLRKWVEEILVNIG